MDKVHDRADGDTVRSEVADAPLVSIGMPVYNGARYVSQALDSLIAQDHENWELIISDNASTDETLSICRGYAARDSRLRVVAQEENRGAAWNFKHVLDQARGTYFMWAAHDDLWANDYVSKCLEALRANPDCVLCCSSVVFIDAEGARVERAFQNLDTRGLSLYARVRYLLSQDFWCATYGVTTTENAKRLSIDTPTFGIDVVTLLELILVGHIIRTERTTFYYRLFQHKSVQVLMEGIDPSRKPSSDDELFTEMVTEMFAAIARSDRRLWNRVVAWSALCRTCLNKNLNLGGQIREEKLSHYFSSRPFSSIGHLAISLLVILAGEPHLVWNRGVWAIFVRSLLRGAAVGAD